MLAFSIAVFSQTVPEPDPPVPEVKTIDGIFETFFALVAFIPLAVQTLRRLVMPNAGGLGVQIFSWVVGLAVTLVGWWFHLGFLDGLSIWMALLYGTGACLAANGIFDTGIITAIFSLFEKRKNV